MADLTLRGGGTVRMTHAQIKELKRKMKLALSKLDGMQDSIDKQELLDSILADQLLEQQLLDI